MLKKNIDLTHDNVLQSILKIAFPIMLTSLLTLSYNLTDMFWLGRVSDSAITAVGASSYLVIFSKGLSDLVTVGTGILVAQSIGKKDDESLLSYSITGIKYSIIIGFICTLLLYFFGGNVLSLIKFNNSATFNDAVNYVKIIGLAMVFLFTNLVNIQLYNSYGRTKLTLLINGIGLFINMLLDPLFIIVFKMDVIGAGIATAISYICVFVIFTYLIFGKNSPVFKEKNNYIKILLTKNLGSKLKSIMKLGVFRTFEEWTYSTIMYFVTIFIVSFGDVYVMVHKVGVQIESLTWLVSGGFSIGLTVFIAQNYGAKKYSRIAEGFNKGFFLMFLYGILTTFILVFFAKEIFSIFTNNDITMLAGKDYLVIVGASQISMCVNAALIGYFNGIGKTHLPAYISIFFLILRLPMSYFLGKSLEMGINGVWLTICLTSYFSSLVMILMYFLHKNINYKNRC